MKKNIITIVLLAAFIAILIFLDLPTYNKVVFLKDEIKRYQDFLGEKEGLVIKVRQLKEARKGYDQEIDKLQYILPSGTEIPSLIVQFEALAAENGLVLEGLIFAEKEVQKTVQRTGEEVEWGAGGATQEVQPASAEDYKTLKVSLELAGTYQAFNNFLKALELNVRLMDIKSIDFIPQKEAGGEIEEGEEGEEERISVSVYDFDVSLEVYYQ